MRRAFPRNNFSKWKLLYNNLKIKIQIKKSKKFHSVLRRAFPRSNFSKWIRQTLSLAETPGLELRWHERQRCSWSTFRQLTGNDVSGPLFSEIFISQICFFRQKKNFGSKSFWPKIFHPKNFLPKIFFDPKSLWPKKFLTQFFLSKIFFDQNFFLPKYFFI